MGSGKPSHCPYCGAHEGLIIFAKDYKEKNKNVTISDGSKNYLRQTLDLEISNSRFYRAISKSSTDTEIQAFFKYLSKIEKEHADVVCKLLDIDLPEEALGVDECFETDKENIEESLRRENRAVTLYREILKNSLEERMKEVFSALIQIEGDHIAKDEEELREL